MEFIFFSLKNKIRITGPADESENWYKETDLGEASLLHNVRNIWEGGRKERRKRLSQMRASVDQQFRSVPFPGK